MIARERSEFALSQLRYHPISRLSPALRETMLADRQAGPPPIECEKLLESIALDCA